MLRFAMPIFALCTVAGCDAVETVEISCPPPAGHTVSVTMSDGPVLPSQLPDLEAEVRRRAMTAARSKCDLHRAREKQAQGERDRALEQRRAEQLTPDFKKTDLGGAVGAGVIAAGLALIGGTSSSSDTQ